MGKAGVEMRIGCQQADAIRAEYAKQCGAGCIQHGLPVSAAVTMVTIHACGQHNGGTRAPGHQLRNQGRNGGGRSGNHRQFRNRWQARHVPMHRQAHQSLMPGIDQHQAVMDLGFRASGQQVTEHRRTYTMGTITGADQDH